MRIAVALLALLSLTTAPLHAFHTASQGITSVEDAQFLMATNPPLPMLHLRKGTWKVVLQPAYFTGEPLEAEGGDPGTETHGEFDGVGLEMFDFFGGINLVFKPIGLDINITAPILKKIDPGETAMVLLTFSLPFGNYVR